MQYAQLIKTQIMIAPIKTIFDRVPLVSFCPVVNTSIFYTVDNWMRAIYVDGVSQTLPADPNGWGDTKELKVSIHKGVVIIAVMCEDDHVEQAGLIASERNGYLLSGNSWKCSNVFKETWEQPTFDDSAWPAAYAYGYNSISLYGLRPQISPSAQWIWTSSYLGHRSDSPIYCRGRLFGPV